MAWDGGCAAEYTEEQCAQMESDGTSGNNTTGGRCPYYMCGNAFAKWQSAVDWCEATQQMSDCPIEYCVYQECIGSNCYPTSKTCDKCSSRQGNKVSTSAWRGPEKETTVRKSVVLCSLLLATNAFAVRLEVQPRMMFVPVAEPRKAQVLREARDAFTLPDGSQWITHPVPAENEGSSAVGVTRFEVDGSATVFLVSDWLPKRSIPNGWCGQVYGVSQLSDGRIAVSAGWTDGSQSHNGIFILRVREDGRYDTDKLIRLPGVAQIVGTQNNSILAVTNDPGRRDHGPLLTSYDTEGVKFGGFFGGDMAVSAVEAAQNAAKARLVRVGETGFAFYNPREESIYLFHFEVGHREGVFIPKTRIFIGDDAEIAALPVVGIDVSEDWEVLVARVGNFRGTIGTHLTVYDSDNKVKQTTTLDRPWNLMLREKGRIHGVVRRGEVSLDTVRLQPEK